MSTFTGSELEFLAGLNKSWWRLYWKELSRLRRIEAKELAVDTPGFAPESGACGEDAPCAPQRRSAANAGEGTALQRRVELAAGNR